MDEFRQLLDELVKHNVLVYKSDGQGACEIYFKKDESDTRPTEMKPMTAEQDDDIVGFNPNNLYEKIPGLINFESE